MRIYLYDVILIHSYQHKGEQKEKVGDERE